MFDPELEPPRPPGCGVFLTAVVLSLALTPIAGLAWVVLRVGWYLYALQRHQAAMERAAGTARDVLATPPRGTLEDDRRRLAVCIARLGMLMAAGDGDVDDRELAAVFGFFRARGAPEPFVRWLQLQVIAGADDLDLDRLTDEVNRILDRDERSLVILFLAGVMAADDEVADEEVSFLFAVGARLGFSEADVRGLLGLPTEASPEDAEVAQALATLGLGSGATREDARRAWRRLARDHHPDRVAHLGPEFVAIAEERMRRINAAWDLLRTALPG